MGQSRGTGRDRRLGVVLLVAGLAGCCSVECAPDRLPHQGIATTSEQLYEVIHHAGQHECWRTIYALTSALTQSEHTYIKFWAALGLDLPEPYEMYELQDVIAGGTLVDTIPGPGGREVAVVEYEEPGGPFLLAQVLVVDETDEKGRRVKRLGLEEQVREGPPVADPATAGHPANAGGS